MSERKLSGEKLIDQVQPRVDALLVSTQPVSDGTNINTFDSKTVPEGSEVGISKSQRPDGNTVYHVRKEMPPDKDGFLQTWDYHWGDGNRSVIYAKRHESRRFSSSIHADDVIEGRALEPADSDQIESLLDAYDKAE